MEENEFCFGKIDNQLGNESPKLRKVHSTGFPGGAAAEGPPADADSMDLPLWLLELLHS